MTDDDRRNRTPTREEMFKAMAWLVEDANKDDSLFFHCAFSLPSPFPTSLRTGVLTVTFVTPLD